MRGATLVEMAFVLPFVVVLIFGIIWLGRAFNIWETLHRAAREGARVAATRTCASCGSALPTSTSVENAVLNSLSASSIDKTKVQIPAGCSGNLSSKICYQRDVALNTSTNFPDQGAIVSLSYPVAVPLPSVTNGTLRWGMSTITLTAQAQMREEN